MIFLLIWRFHIRIFLLTQMYPCLSLIRLLIQGLLIILIEHFIKILRFFISRAFWPTNTTAVPEQDEFLKSCVCIFVNHIRQKFASIASAFIGESDVYPADRPRTTCRMRDNTLPLIGVPLLYFTGKRVLPGGVGHDAPPHPTVGQGSGPSLHYCVSCAWPGGHRAICRSVGQPGVTRGRGQQSTVCTGGVMP